MEAALGARTGIGLGRLGKAGGWRRLGPPMVEAMEPLHGHFSWPVVDRQAMLALT